MKMNYFLSLLLAFPFFCGGQVTIVSQVPAASLIMKDQLWNAVVSNNSNNVVKLRIQLDIRDLEMGHSVLNANTAAFSVAKGIKLITINEVQPVMYNYVSNELGGNFLPCGNYRFHFMVIQETDKGDIVVADDLQKINIRPLSPPLLIYPAEKTTITNLHPQFSWVPPGPIQMYNPLLYDFKLVKIEGQQSPSEAMEANVPVYFSDNIVNPVMNLPSSFSSLEKGKKYAWGVIAKSNMSCYTFSAIHQFNIDSSETVKPELPLTSFIKMKRGEYSKTIAPAGELKISYINDRNESVAKMMIIEPGAKKEVLYETEIKLGIGENLMSYDISRLVKLKEGKVYEFRIINGRGEIWQVQFEFIPATKNK
jgi:hypothetical protein